MMGRILVVCCLLLASGAAFAQTPPAAQAADQPAAAESSGLQTPLLITAGVVAGVVAADLLTGGALTGSLFGVTRAATQPMFTVAQTREMTASGALIGEAIAPATAWRDVPARAEMWRLVALAAGGVAGWLGVSKLLAD
jgi:hypothetical protein